MDKLIITAVPGGGTDETRAAALQAAASVDACSMGASVAHLRARLSPTREPDVDDWLRLVDRIRSRCDMLLQFGRVTMPPKVRRKLLELRPDAATFLLGHHDIINAEGPLHGLCTFEDQQEIAGDCLELGVLPECLVNRAGNAWNLRRLIDQGLLRPPFYATITLGAAGGEWSPATPRELLKRVRMLPPGTVWGVAVQGPERLALNALAISLGGHVRLALEANAADPDGARRRNQAALQALIRLAGDLGRDVASPTEARRMLGLPRLAGKAGGQ